ncbi:molybdenum cofactor biosynthesis protein MoaE [Chloroflexota bacterium]
MIEITEKPISPEIVVDRAKTDSSGCVVTYVGLIRETSQGKPVVSVEYQDREGTAQTRLTEIADEIRQQWQVNDLAICHRIGKLKVGDINLVIAIATSHRPEGFAACQYAVNRFKEKMPTQKKETYEDGSTCTDW